MKRLSILSLLLVAACAAARDEGPPAVAAPDNPDTEIFLARFSFENGAPSIREIWNATKRKGYDNQPRFLAGEAAFHYVAAGESGKTDIRLYDIARRASEAATDTPDRSEYSPKEAPSGGLSYIQENPAGDVTRVHRRAPGEADGAPVVDFAPLGYYAWLDGGAALGVYYRTEPGSLYRVDVESGATRRLHESIGRTLQADREVRWLWFSEITDPEANAMRIMRYDAAGGAITPIFDLPAGATDFFAVLGDRGAAEGFLAASGPAIFWRAAAADGWTPVADLADAGVRIATRIAVSDDRSWIAVVGEVAE